MKFVVSIFGLLLSLSVQAEVTLSKNIALPVRGNLSIYTIRYTNGVPEVELDVCEVRDVGCVTLVYSKEDAKIGLALTNFVGKNVKLIPDQVSNKIGVEVHSGYMND
ncbi:MAG: hypothetical protein KDD40_00455 [Bdellovibrionales bacterium]|nr:hypothetical protein [Bdellovibrionales bacterium]